MAITLRDYIEEPIRKELKGVIDIVSQELPETPEEAFVSTEGDLNGRNYPSVWLFTPHLLVEIRNPLNQDRTQFEFSPFERSVDWIRLNARKYDFENCTEQSRLALEFTTKDGLDGTLMAAGRGCSHLMEIYNQRFLKNFTGLPATSVSPKRS